MIVQPPPDVDSFLADTFRRGAFPELVRAAEGVPRDAINIAALAAQHAHNEPIGLPDVRRAARDWYLRDKQTAINANHPARQMLRSLIEEVVGRRHSRTFLLDQLAARHETIDELYDARLLHVLRRGIADPKESGHALRRFRHRLRLLRRTAHRRQPGPAPRPRRVAEIVHRRPAR